MGINCGAKFLHLLNGLIIAFCQSNLNFFLVVINKINNEI